MDINFLDTLAGQFEKSLPHVEMNLLKSLRVRFPGHQLIFVDEWSVEEWLAHQEGRSIEEVRGSWEDAVNHVAWDPHAPRKDSDELFTTVSCGHRNINFEGKDFTVIKMSWNEFGYNRNCLLLMWPGSMSEGRELIRAVYTMNRTLMWVLDQGWWKPANDLRTSIQSTTWDDLVLDDAIIKSLKNDATQFFKRKAQYQKLGVPWKRGILFLGEPGNGKSLAIKNVVNEIHSLEKCPCLYVKSLQGTSDGDVIWGVRYTFNQARKLSPCVLVLEDLDSLLDAKNRTFFLNELDGFQSNDGILILASSNHPEKIDPAILNRPSRFDVKYNFPLPTEELRQRYAKKWLAKLKKKGSSLAFDEETLAKEIAKKTDEFSFAFLQELFVSSSIKALNMVEAGEKPDFQSVVLSYVEDLRPQIKPKAVEEAAATTAVSRSITLFGKTIPLPQDNQIIHFLFTWAFVSSLTALLLFHYPLHR